MMDVHMASNGSSAVPFDYAAELKLPPRDIGDQIKTPHNDRLYLENQNLKKRVNDLFEYQNANPRILNPTSRADIAREKEVSLEIQKQQNRIVAQLAVMKTLFRDSVMKVREEKSMTTDSRNGYDKLILEFNNLQYEKENLKSQISAAQNYAHKYQQLPLIPVEEFLEEFPEYKDATEQKLMTARIEHEHQVRVKLEERRQEKLKQKQMLISEHKKSKDEVTNLDVMVEKFIEAAKPIKEILGIDE